MPYSQKHQGNSNLREEKKNTSFTTVSLASSQGHSRWSANMVRGGQGWKGGLRVQKYS